MYILAPPHVSMKYHYQFVSGTTVRIELIPEYKNEIALLEALPGQPVNEELLSDFYGQGLAAYHVDSLLTNLRFMNFPKVALCTFRLQKQMV